MMNKILVVEDNQDIQDFISEILAESEFVVETASDGGSALKNVEKSTPDLIVLDLGLPDIDGESVCREVKKKHPEVPIIILTAKGSVEDKVHGLELGADDYLSKPFEGDELVARIKARLRSTNNASFKLKVGDLELDRKTFQVKRGSKLIKLTPKEFKLLEYLMANKGRILPREMILNRVWLYSPDIDSRAVDVYIGYLRDKIDAGNKKKLLQSVRGFGYMIKD
ncbi:MAG: response regulator transcription factor [Candidatus Curtissbacteria bacterium]|nr:response regulator transcription factor [Candidatus Curtissbacteria bacterium]